MQGTLVFAAGSQPVETSEDAADSLGRDHLAAVRRDVLQFFARRAAHGAIADEIAAAWKCDHNHVAPRCTELLKLGYLALVIEPKPSGIGNRVKRRATRKGRTARIMTITDAGVRMLRVQRLRDETVRAFS
jgi:hypothetical protein